jgi:ABC-type transport system substrate-binding protein
VRIGRCLAGWCLAVLASASFAQGTPAAAPKVLRYSFPAGETGFDPAQVSDLYSRTVLAHIFDALYRFDYLARPVKVVPNTAAGMPEVSADHRVWTVRIQPGIFYADDPAFGGRKRELVAQDYVYALKRFFDPALKSPVYSGLKEQGILGLDALRQDALKSGKPFDYDRDIEGLRAIDRHTLQVRLEAPRPRFLYQMAQSGIWSGVAREVIEAYPGTTMEHPVGTGPFRLVQWRRSSKMVLERNPNFRAMVYDGQPAPDDAEAQALLRRLRGRPLPMVDRVEVNVIEESQPRWLAFLNGEFDLVAVPLEFSNVAAPNGKLAVNLAKRGMQYSRTLLSDRVLYYFNMEDPVIGGYTADKVALRRAIGLATDVALEINLARRGQAIPAQSIIAPHTYGYDADFKSHNSDHDPARAKALLDMYGYVDRDGDGWRDLPDGRPLVIQYASQPDSISRQFDELWKKSMDAVGLRLRIEVGQWPEQLKKARAGQLMLWQLGYSSTIPDMQDTFEILFGPASGGQNLARFRMDAFDALYRRMQMLPDGPDRLQAIAEANKLLLAYAPHKYTVHRIANDIAQPWLVGYLRPPFGNQFWHWVDIDPAAQRAARR